MSQAISMRLSRGGDALWILLRDPASLVEVPLREFRPGRRVRLATPPDTLKLPVLFQLEVPQPPPPLTPT